MTTSTQTQAPRLDGFPEFKGTPAKRRALEVTLAKRIEKKDEKAVETLVMTNMREAVLYAWRCCNHRIPGEEIIDICYDELKKGALRFSSSRGTRFFAFMKATIRGSLKTYWARQNVVRGGGPGISLEELSFAESCSRSKNGLTPQYARHALTPSFTPPDLSRLLSGEKYAILQKVLERALSEHERMILNLYYEHGYKFIEIGRLLDVSKAAAHIVHKMAIIKIRRYLMDNPEIVKELKP